MKVLLTSPLLFLGMYQNTNSMQSRDAREIIAQIAINERISVSLNHYYNRNDTVFFQLPTALGSQLKLRKVTYADFNEKQRTIYGVHQANVKKPTIEITVLKAENDSARVVLGIPIEGVVGRFKLVKTGHWIVVAADVYQI